MEKGSMFITKFLIHTSDFTDSEITNLNLVEDFIVICYNNNETQKYHVYCIH